MYRSSTIFGADPLAFGAIAGTGIYAFRMTRAHALNEGRFQ